MNTAWQSADDALEQPTHWPMLEPERVPQSSNWSDRPLRGGAIKPTITPDRAGRAFADADPRSRLPATPLTVVARGWMRNLPLKARPGLTAQRHPHVVNRLALVWPEPELLDACFRELLVSDRLDRKGFALDVLSELLLLQTFSVEPPRR